MDGKITLLNHSYGTSEEVYIVEHSGCVDDLPQRVKEHLTVAEAENLDAGDWVTIVDGEVKNTGQFHPSHILIEEPSLDDQLRDFAEEHNVAGDAMNVIQDAVHVINNYQE